jgi:sulfite reductase (NADPH) flavoprotein alpha-component
MSEARWGGQPPAELVPENAPFDEEQRAWLNGFLAGLLGLGNGGSGANGANPAEARAPTDAALDPARAASGAAAGAGVPGEAPGSGVVSSAAAASTGLDSESSLEQARAARGVDRAYAATAAGSSVGRRGLRGPEEPASGTVVSARAALGVGPSGIECQRLRVKSHRKVTLADAGSEIRELILELADPRIQYQVGDCLAVFPHNDPDLVRALLRAVGARGQEMVTTPNGATEVWRCLLEDLDITHVKDETLRLFADEAGRSDELGSLRESLSMSLSLSTPSGFDLLDLLSMFPGSRPSLERIIGTLGTLEPRLYAIASSPSYHPGELHLAVRVVRAERGGRERRGVASHFLSEGVFRGDDVLARVQPAERFVLPIERTGPVIMLGSGTGLARFRAFLQELEARGRRGNTWLIMASCFEGDEALYESELKAWSRIGVLEHLDVVKLGQRGRRVGPEDVLRKRARRVLSWLDRGAFVYACGEGKHLSAALSDTLIDLLGRQGKMSRSEAADFLHVMRRDGRYVEEVY